MRGPAATGLPPPPPVQHRAMRALRVGLVLLVLLAAAVVASLLAGSGDLGDPRLRPALLELRGLRTAAAGLVGAALAVAGVLVQGLFRNPLASPSILGTSAGAALGGQAALLLHAALAAALPVWLAPEMALPLGCLAGAGAALALVLAFAGRRDLVGLLLAGFALSSLFAAVGAFLTALAQEEWLLGRAMLAFVMGGVEGVGARHLALAAPLVVAGILAAWSWGRELDCLLAGEDEAAALGVDVGAARRWTLAWVAMLTGAATAIGGMIVFVGLVVPHALRPFTGVEHRRLVPAAAVGGAAFLIAADAFARALPGAVPLGVVTGLVGAPVFLVLLARQRRVEGWA